MQSLHREDATVDGKHKHKYHLHAGNRMRGRFNYHLRDPAPGSTMLATKNHFIAMIGEYVGTSLFMIFALGGTNVANIPSTSVTGATQAGQDQTQAQQLNTSNLLFIALSFGFSLAVNAWIFFRVSGGLFNPAVSFAMLLSGALSPLRAVLLTIAQLLGALTGSGIIQALLPGTLNVRTTLAPGMSVARGLFLEMFLTIMLMLAILLLAAEKSKATFLAPIGIGLALFIAELLGVYYTGGSLNPARSFGPCVVLGTFESYHWIYWVGPYLGSTLAAGFYRFIKWLEFETVLGPEDDGDSPRSKKVGQLAAPAENLLGTPAATSEKASTDEEPKGALGGLTQIAVQGPGLGDLLTEGDGAQVMNLGEPVVDYNARFNRIEEMLAALTGAQLSAQPTTHSDATVAVDDRRHKGDEQYVPDDTLRRDGHVKYSIDRTVVGDENV
ncbi:hypothetical protein JCM10212_003728 [Sporobolomyces blumeae]